MKAFYLTLLGCLLYGVTASAQGAALPLGNPAYHMLDRLEIKTGIPAPYHSALKYYTRGAATRYALTIDTTLIPLSVKDRRDLYYIFKDNNEWLGAATYHTTLAGEKELTGPERDRTQIESSLEDSRYILSKRPVFNTFYRTPANLYEVNDKYFHLRVNPMLNFRLAVSRDDEQPVFLNQRGLELRGGVDDRIYFYTNVVESQARFPEYVNERIERDRALPGAGLYKRYESSIFDIQNGYDYLNGQGYIGFNITRHVGAQFGYGRNFIGNGYRSMLLSDFANNYFYLKLNWQVWRFQLQNIFAELGVRPPNGSPGPDAIDRKYMATHHLSFNITPSLNVGIFESVIFSRNNRFALQYLNPVILYRTIEQAVGSPDNVLLGFDAKWNLLNRFQLYGQIIFDEFVFNELVREPNGWWANKFGVQAGLKYIDVLDIDHLDLQVELNLARPYLYSYSNETAVYNHLHQPLAHPLGANFREFLVIGRYQPWKKVFLEGRLIRATFGEDAEGTNWGGNLQLSYDTRERDYGNEIAQGVSSTTLLAGLDVSYMVSHNVFLELEYFFRNQDSEDDARDQKVQYFGGGIRVNIGKQRMDF